MQFLPLGPFSTSRNSVQVYAFVIKGEALQNNLITKVEDNENRPFQSILVGFYLKLVGSSLLVIFPS